MNSLAAQESVCYTRRKAISLVRSVLESQNATISPPNVAKSQQFPVFATFKVKNVAI